MVRYSENWRTQHCGNWTCFSHQVKGETPSLLGSLERTDLNHWTRSEDGNSSIFRKVQFSSFQSSWRWTKSRNPAILNVMHHHHNPLESTYKMHVMKLYGKQATWKAGKVNYLLSHDTFLFPAFFLSLVLNCIHNIFNGTILSSMFMKSLRCCHGIQWKNTLDSTLF
jgi:pterin-4a-carbinolamine dehydratase